MTQQKGDRIEDMFLCSLGKLNEESVSSGSEWVRISTRNAEYSKGMNGMNSTKVNDITDKVNTHMQTYTPNIYIQTYIHKRMFIVDACPGVARHLPPPKAEGGT